MPNGQPGSAAARVGVKGSSPSHQGAAGAPGNDRHAFKDADRIEGDMGATTGSSWKTPKAMYWYRKAADQGDASAQCNLGVMYDKGQYMPQDYVYAYMWFNLSAAQGNQTAAKNQDNVARRMTPTQIAEYRHCRSRSPEELFVLPQIPLDPEFHYFCDQANGDRLFDGKLHCTFGGFVG
jgi:hypothetical protein